MICLANWLWYCSVSQNILIGILNGLDDLSNIWFWFNFYNKLITYLKYPRLALNIVISISIDKKLSPTIC